MKMYKATIQVLIHSDEEPIDSDGAAADWFIGLLTDHPEVYDWSYMQDKKHRSSYAYPRQVEISHDDYEEGDGFNGSVIFSGPLGILDRYTKQ